MSPVLLTSSPTFPALLNQNRIKKIMIFISKPYLLSSKSNLTRLGQLQMWVPVFQGRQNIFIQKIYIIFRTNRAFGQFEEEHFLYHVITTGRHFLSFWGPISSESRAQKEQRSGGKLDQRPHKDYLVDVYDRATNTKGTIVYNNQDKDFNNVKPQEWIKKRCGLQK